MMDNQKRLIRTFKLLRRLDRVLQSQTSLTARDIEIVEVVLDQTISILVELTETIEKFVVDEGSYEATPIW